MASRKRVLLVSASMVLLCLCIIVGATYALFTDTVTVENHLQSGDLDLGLYRTYLEYTVLDAEGRNDKEVITTEVDFTETNIATANIFGITDDRVIAPGNYVKATLEIRNDGNVAFDYDAYIKLDSAVNDLAKQLQVTVTDANGVKIGETKFLSEMTQGENGYLITSGTSIGTSDNETFTVQILFVDYAEDAAVDNDDAQDMDVSFDLIVNATQNTEPNP